ncbi:MAG: response regulator [bacterium]
MKSLIVEDDFVARRILKDILSAYGHCDIAIDGQEAVCAFRMAWEENRPYDLVCMDIMMPNIDGHEALRQIRELEDLLCITNSRKVKAIMLSALDDPKNVVRAFAKGEVSSYLVKPIKKQDLVAAISKLGLLA